jgi:chromate reductase
MSSYKLLAFSGSLRKGSLNTSLANAFIANAPEGVSVEFVDWSDIPFFSEDLEGAVPASVTALKNRIKAADGIIIATPEYNRGVPGAFKNMIDWTSRPYGDNSWDGTPVFISGATNGHLGTALAQHSLKSIMQYLNTHLVGQPEFYLNAAQEKFDAEGNLTDETTKAHIQKAWSVLVALIDKFH